MKNTISDQLKHAVILLKNSQHPRLEAELLLSHLLQKPRSYLFSHSEQILHPDELHQFHQLIQKRVKGQPIAYLLGGKEFWSLSLCVTSDTLIPRPETELLVELSLEKLSKNIPQRVADLGTGTGAIALAIASERPNWTIQATDFSDKALAIARTNAKRLHLQNILFSQGDWCEALDGQFDIIVSNPPYISENDPHLVEGDVRFEPHYALVSAENGLRDLRLIITQAKHHLVHHGWLMLEHGYNQAEAVRDMMQELRYRRIMTYRDTADIERVTVGMVDNEYQ